MRDSKRTEEQKQRAMKSEALQATNIIYKKALSNLGLEHGQWWEHEVKIGVEYRKLLRTLPTSILETIIQENLEDIVRRDDSTIEEILSELANRILIEGENETHIELAN